MLDIKKSKEMNKEIKRSFLVLHNTIRKNKFLIFWLIFFGNCENAVVAEEKVMPADIPNLLCFWDFQQSNHGDLTSKGQFNYNLKEMNGSIARVNEGIFGPASLEIKKGQWLLIKREDCPGLNIYGNREVTVIAWVKREKEGIWQYIAGVWNERDAKRQYALFTCGHKQTDYTTLNRTDAKNQIHGYVSDVGGATPDRPYCFSYATGKQMFNVGEWHMLSFTYDHNSIKVYFDGDLDGNGNSNPFYWDKPIFDGGKNGADFTVAQRALPKWPGYPETPPDRSEGFSGLLSGLAIYDRALDSEEIKSLYNSTMLDLYLLKK